MRIEPAHINKHNLCNLNEPILYQISVKLPTLDIMPLYIITPAKLMIKNLMIIFYLTSKVYCITVSAVNEHPECVHGSIYI